MDHEGPLHATYTSDLAPSMGHEDLAQGDGLDLCSRRRGAALGVLQPQLKRPPWRHLFGKEWQ